MQNIGSNRLDNLDDIEYVTKQLEILIRSSFKLVLDLCKKSEMTLENYSYCISATALCDAVSVKIINKLVLAAEIGWQKLVTTANKDYATETLSSTLHRYINCEIKTLDQMDTIDDIYNALFKIDNDSIEFISSYVANTSLAVK
ncbi:hypothetical protein [Cysteiniphilum sp. SYW-8]|nr:hypothetical protein [Cysteiniphilum sp. SYW-8]